jgi:hypothetical protein
MRRQWSRGDIASMLTIDDMTALLYLFLDEHRTICFVVPIHFAMYDFQSHILLSSFTYLVALIFGNSRCNDTPMCC